MVTITSRFAHSSGRMAAMACALSLILVTGCASTPSIARPGESISPTATVIDKAGSPSSDGVLTFRVAWYGGEGRPQARVVERFAEEVASASDGAIQIDIAYDTGDSWQNSRMGTSTCCCHPPH